MQEQDQKMKIFLDTANLESIKKYNDMGAIDGITTNPSLLSKEKGNPARIMNEIVRIVKGPVSLEVLGTKAEEMIEEAHRLKKYGQNVVVKIPMIPEGMRAVKKLREEGIETNVTLIFSATQAILAAKAGASYISPFIGRLDDAGQEGMILIKEIVQIFKNYKFETEVLVASIRHPLHVVEAGKIGAQIVTLPPDILGKMLMHPLTEKGLAAFLSDWEKVKKENSSLII
jgi:transaldolase